MISKEEIKKMADLARIDLSDAEIEGLRGEMDAILNYVGQIKEVAGEEGLSREALLAQRSFSEVGAKWEGEVNVMREDANPTESETYSKELIAEFPDSENNYLKVKKIL